MDHSVDVHREYYRMPHDLMQNTQISKIFLALEQGKMKSLAGKRLSEVDSIEVNDDRQSVDRNVLEGEFSVHVTRDDREETVGDVSEMDSTEDDEDSPPKQKIRRRAPHRKQPLLKEDNSKILKYFRAHIMNKKTPNLKECEAFKRESFKEYSLAKD